jgi:hypothetical protein
MSQAVSDKKSEQGISDSFRDDSYFGGKSREQMLNELRVRIERFYERATREQIQEATRVVQSLLAARGLLPEQASKRSSCASDTTSITIPVPSGCSIAKSIHLRCVAIALQARSVDPQANGLVLCSSQPNIWATPRGNRRWLLFHVPLGNVSWKEKGSNEYKTRTEWHRVISWDKRAEWAGIL